MCEEIIRSAANERAGEIKSAQKPLWQNEVGVKSRQCSYFTFLSHLKNNIRRRNTSSKSSSVPFSPGPIVRFLRAQKLHIDFHYTARHLNAGGAGQKYKYFKRTLLWIIPADTVLNTPATFHNTALVQGQAMKMILLLYADESCPWEDQILLYAHEIHCRVLEIYLQHPCPALFEAPCNYIGDHIYISSIRNGNLSSTWNVIAGCDWFMRALLKTFRNAQYTFARKLLKGKYLELQICAHDSTRMAFEQSHALHHGNLLFLAYNFSEFENGCLFWAFTSVTRVKIPFWLILRKSWREFAEGERKLKKSRQTLSSPFVENSGEWNLIKLLALITLSYTTLSQGGNGI